MNSDGDCAGNVSLQHILTRMAESIVKASTEATRKEQYETLFPQLVALVEGESDLIANLANLMAALKEAMSFFWVGVYFVKGEELVLGPFQGPLACTRIGYGKGVCGNAWKEGKVIVVPDVDAFPGHIACSSLSKSEIVLPAFHQERVYLVMDVDSEFPNDFQDDDVHYLGKVMRIIESLIKTPVRK
ncbi:GAF domain-containing protein [soil metagenome]